MQADRQVNGHRSAIDRDGLLSLAGLAFVCEQEGYEGVVRHEPSIAATVAGRGGSGMRVVPGSRVSIHARTSASFRSSATRLEGLQAGCWLLVLLEYCYMIAT